MNISQQTGMILLATLLFLSLISLFVLSHMQMIWIYYQSNNTLIKKHDLLRKVENEIATFLVTDPVKWPEKCIIHNDNANAFIDKIDKNKNCLKEAEGNKYWYLIEDIGINACIQSLHQNQLFSTHHWRITLAVFTKPMLGVQLRFFKLAKLIPCKSDEIIYVPPGIMSWRLIGGA